MKRVTPVLLACALLITMSGHAGAQTTRVEGGVRSLSGVDFYWETRLVPPVPPLDDRLRMLTRTSGTDTVHRVMVDRSRKVYFGYDAQVAIVRAEAETKYRIAFGPLSLTSELLQSILGEDPKTWKLLPAPRFPAPRVVRSGEVLELTLLTNDAQRQQLSEYVTLQEPRRSGFNYEPPREFTFAGGTPRDFATGDVELQLQEPRVNTTGLSLTAPQAPPLEWASRDSADQTAFKSPGSAAGPIVWIYVPGRGRFLLSLTPRSTFQRAGEVRGSSLRFTVDGQTYDVWSSSRIAPATAAFNLYVRRQPEWKPSYPNANLDTIHIGASDRLEYLVEKQ